MSTIPEKERRAVQIIENRRIQTGRNPNLVTTLPAKTPLPVLRSVCVHEGPVLDFCITCQGETAELRHVRECDVHERCTRGFVSHLVRFCGRCESYEPSTPLPEDSPVGGVDSRTIPESPAARIPASPRRIISQPLNRPVRPVGAQSRGNPRVVSQSLAVPETMTLPLSQRRERRWKRPPVWTYGVTTVPERRHELLPRTLESLKRAGFERPTLFVDGGADRKEWAEAFGLDVVCRYPRLRAYGNWALALGELYLRNPHADYFAIFQDDMVCSRNLRSYLEQINYPARGYMNLYTFPRNQGLIGERVGFYKVRDRGQGALALVFNYDAISILFTHLHMVKRARDRERGHKYIDGGVVETMNLAGYSEFVHSPSLVQHLGKRSTLGNPNHPQSPSFRGEQFDALTLLGPGEAEEPDDG